MDTPATEHTAKEHTSDERAADARKHDVRFTTSARQSFMYTANRGVMLTPDGIAWTFDGKPDGAPFKNIVEVCVQKGPGAHRFVPGLSDHLRRPLQAACDRRQ